MNPTDRTPSLEAVLNDFALAQDVPDAALLDDFARRFPQYAAQLTEYAVDLALTLAADDQAPVPVDTSESSENALRAISRIQNKIYEHEKSAAHVGAVAAPLEDADLDLFAKLATDEIRALCTRLNVNLLFLVKVRDRRIREDTIPQAFCTTLANELHAPVATVRKYFRRPPSLSASASYKAETKPELDKQETFEEAVESSALTPDQQASLKKMLQS